MSIERPRHRLDVYLPPQAVAPQAIGGGAESVLYHHVPAPRFVGRHLLWPAQLRRRRFDAFFGAAGVLPLGVTGCPEVVTLHDLAIYLHPKWFPSGQPLSTRVIVPASIRRAAAIIAVSHNTARDARELFGVDSDRIRVIPEGVSSRYRPLSREDVEPVRVRLGLPQRFLLFVSAIEPRKNLDTLLEAWALVPGRQPLVVVGGWGWQYERTRERLERLGSGVLLLGEARPELLPALYNLATCLVHPAWYEGFGLPPLEAMACGTPVVCSNSSSLPEVTDDAALLVDPGDVEGWRRALERIITDGELRTELRRKGILRAAEFSWERTAQATWEVIEALATGKSG
jgi:glycosyltransferase involved in cell wall biosynthesis